MHGGSNIAGGYQFRLKTAGQVVIIAKITRRATNLRRTYARRLYEAGVDLLAIQQNLGHADHKTTELYIGRLDVGARKPPALYTFDVGALRDDGV